MLDNNHAKLLHKGEKDKSADIYHLAFIIPRILSKPKQSLIQVFVMTVSLNEVLLPGHI